MARSYALMCHNAFTRRKGPARYEPGRSRPEGELIWIHVPNLDNIQSILDLAQRLCAQRHGVHILITGVRFGFAPLPDIIFDGIAGEHPRDIERFLDHWQPDLLLWSFGDLRPNLILTARQRNLPMMMIDVDQEGFSKRSERWFPYLLRDVLHCFQKILVRDDAAMGRLRKIIRTPDILERSGPLIAGGQILDYSQSDFDELTQSLSGRPVWFAAAVQMSEVHMVLEAHRHALRMSHRLLLVLNPVSERMSATCITQLQNEGLRYAHWDDGVFPDENCQVLLVTSQEELGLWYRLSPLSFLGSSLSFDQNGLDPFQAAALGTAVLYGPNVRKHMNRYTRLAAAGAARIVNSSSALGIAVARLMAPDHVASMALAGWDVVTKGAAITDRVIELTIALMETPGEG